MACAARSSRNQGRRREGGAVQEPLIEEPPLQEQATEPAAPGPPPAASPRRRRLWLALGVVAVVVAALFARSYVGATRPVARALAADSGNSGIDLAARYEGYWDSSVLILDLVRAEQRGADHFFRALFQAAEAMHDEGNRFDSVRLARDGHTVFLLDGSDFRTLGEQFAHAENPVYMVRTLPAKLKHPGGSSAYAQWTGGWLGVLSREMEDANSAAKDGRRPDVGRTSE